jgi:hypothetical protein
VTGRVSLCANVLTQLLAELLINGRVSERYLDSLGAQQLSFKTAEG